MNRAMTTKSKIWFGVLGSTTLAAACAMDMSARAPAPTVERASEVSVSEVEERNERPAATPAPVEESKPLVPDVDEDRSAAADGKETDAKKSADKNVPTETVKTEVSAQLHANLPEGREVDHEREPNELRVLRDPKAREMIFQNYGVNPTIDTQVERFSTFSIDVDTAAYTMTRAYLARGSLPSPDSVRVEEFVNAFDYDYEAPTDVAFSIDAEAFPSRNRRGYHTLRLGLKGKEISKAQRRPSNLVFVIDVSGSMNLDNRLGLVKRALQLLVEQLDGRDAVSIVVYGDSAHTVLAPTPGSDKGTILAAISALRPEGSTNVQAGLALGYEMAAERADPGTNNRIILCSDGVANNGITEADGIFGSIRERARNGIEITTVGFGMGNYNDVLMEKLADSGNGNYAYVDRLDQAKKIFVEQLTGTLEVIAKDVKIQLELDPSVVARYRLVGYENRALRKKDFEDDAIDAGEIGAGHEVTAIYEIKLKKPGTLGSLRVRFKDPKGSVSKLVERPLLASIVKDDVRGIAPTSRLALVLSTFAEKLRGSYWARNVSYAQLLGELDELPSKLRERTDVAELRGLIENARRLDVREDRFEGIAPIAQMNFDDLPILR